MLVLPASLPLANKSAITMVIPSYFKLKLNKYWRWKLLSFVVILLISEYYRRLYLTLTDDGTSKMDFQDLILQGGALAVVLACFIFVLWWLLGHFARSLNRIERGLHATTLAMLALSKAQMHANFNLNGFDPNDKDSKAVMMYDDVLKTLDDIEKMLDALAKELER